MDPKVLAVIDRVEGFIAHKDDALALPREAARFAHALILATGAKRCLEIGTSYGYSGLWIAAAARENGGTLITLDKDPRKCDIAAAHFADAGLGGHVKITTGVALQALEPLEGGFDFVLVDADKEHCIRYVGLVEPKLNRRGIVLTDNTLTHADKLAGFLSWIRRHPSFESAHVPIGNGMEMSVKA